MNNRIYFDEHIEFLKSGYRRMNTRNLTKAFNERFGMDKPESAIKTIIYKKQMRCWRKGNDRLIEDRYTLLTKDQAEFVKYAYKKMPIHDVTSALNKHFGTEFGENQIEAYINNHGFKSGRTGQFKKGNKPWNDGTKGQGLTKAMQLVIMDAISNGHTDKDAMIEYMASQAFKTAVKYYVDMFKSEFAK